MIPFSDIEKWAENRWVEVLKAELTGESIFPKPVNKKKFPKSMSTGEQFAVLDEVRNKAKVLIGPDERIEKRGYGYTYHLAERGVAAKNREARLLEFATLDDYLQFVGKVEEFGVFRDRCRSLKVEFPRLEDWILKNVLKVIELEPLWDRIVDVLKFFQANPMPDLFLRELQLPVDTKFIERNVKLLDSLLEIVLPDDAIVGDEDIFEKKYGLQWVEPLIRICFLDKGLQKDCGQNYGDFGLPVRTLAAAKWPVKRVLVIENLTTLVSLRNRGMTNVLGLHGHGYRVANFADLTWLNDCEVYYWGDIDVQGFEILSLFRSKFPHTRSVLMDRYTVDATSTDFHGTGKPSRWRSEPKLTDLEYQAWQWAREGWRQIEQEHLPPDLVNAELGKVL